jgi:hypothetical protein
MFDEAGKRRKLIDGKVKVPRENQLMTRQTVKVATDSIPSPQ